MQTNAAADEQRELARARWYAGINSGAAILVIATCWGAMGGGAVGFLLSIISIGLWICTCACPTSLPERTCCTGCCSLCPECGEFSTAWHIRNSFVLIFVLALPLGFVAPMVAGPILVSTSGGCSHSCYVESYTDAQCEECGQIDSSFYLGTCSHGYESRGFTNIECQDHDSYYGNEREVRLEQCEKACDCIGGEIHNECGILAIFGWVGIVNAFAVLGLTTTTAMTICAFNTFLHKAGYKGRSQVDTFETTAAATPTVVGQPVGTPIKVSTVSKGEGTP